jgi:hypothetical protein
MSIDLNDDGFEMVYLKDAEGKVLFKKELDLWETQNHIFDLQEKFKGKPHFEFHAAVVDYLKKLGFPPVSHRFADRLVGQLNAKVKELKNAPAGDPSPGSPASTASTPSA